jgi:hypothetical protein
MDMAHHARVESESWSLDPVTAMSLVSRVITEIDARDEQGRRELLETFLSAAWGCRRALDQ